MIEHQGRRGWQRVTSYGRRSLVETAMVRDKTLIGWRLQSAWTEAEVRMGCAVTNRMTRLGRPASCRVV